MLTKKQVSMDISKLIKEEIKKNSFNRFGLSDNPFIPWLPKDPIPSFVNRESEIKSFVRYLTSMTEGNLSTITVLGTKGIGKTHFLHTMFFHVKKLEEELGHRVEFMDGAKFDEYVHGMASIDGNLAEKTIVFLDGADDVWRNDSETLRRFYYGESQNIKLITAFNPSTWKNTKNVKFQLHLKTAIIYLKGLEKKHLIEMIIKRVSEKMLVKRGGEIPFEKDVLEFFASVSEGIPWTMITLAEKSLQRALDLNANGINMSIAENVVGEMNLRADIIYKLPNPQKRVLVALLNLMSSSKRGISAGEIALSVGVTRPAIVQNLKKLEREKCVTPKRDGRTVFYYLNPIIQRSLENQLREEFIPEGVQEEVDFVTKK